MINLKINNIPVTVPEGTTVLQAAKHANIEIPSLCYLKDVNCRADTQNDKGVYIIRTLTASNSAAAYIRDGETFYTDTVQEAMDVITGETYSPKTGDTVKLFRDVTDESEVKVERVEFRGKSSKFKVEKFKVISY